MKKKKQCWIFSGRTDYCSWNNSGVIRTGSCYDISDINCPGYLG